MATQNPQQKRNIATSIRDFLSKIGLTNEDPYKTHQDLLENSKDTMNRNINYSTARIQNYMRVI